MPQFVIIGNFRYANAKLMGVGHDWLEENGDCSGFKGIIRIEAFHIVPDRGMGLFFFDTKESAKESSIITIELGAYCVPKPLLSIPKITLNLR